jgi:hypothetical protein
MNIECFVFNGKCWCCKTWHKNYEYVMCQRTIVHWKWLAKIFPSPWSLIKLYKVKPYILFHLILIVCLRCWFKQQNTCLDDTCTRSNAKLMIWNGKNSNIPRIIVMVKKKCHFPNPILHICKLPIFLFFKKSNPKPISFKLISFHQYNVRCMTNK